MTPGAESEFYLQQANAQCLFFGYSVVIFAPQSALTQTVTQTRKRLGSIGWTQWMSH